MTANLHDSAIRSAKYADHVTQLGKAFGIAVRQTPGMRPEDAGMGTETDTKTGRSWPFIRVVPIIDESTYAVAMHELGHALHPTGNLHSECSKTYRTTGEIATLRDIKLILVSERSAWEWAKQYALEWTPVMASVHAWAIETYLKTGRQLGLKETNGTKEALC